MTLTTLDQLQSEANTYTIDLENFLTANELIDLFAPPVDHLAVKLANTEEYESFIEYISIHASAINYIELNNRRIAYAHLIGEIQFGSLGATSYLEIMEPRPEKVGKDKVGFEHIEIINPNLDSIYQRVKAKNLQTEFYDNGFHKAVVLKIDDQGREIKFTDKPIKDVLMLEESQGRLKKIK
jgi:predicted metalloenzyme YecM